MDVPGTQQAFNLCSPLLTLESHFLLKLQPGVPTAFFSLLALLCLRLLYS